MSGSDKPLAGKVAIVTGAGRGIGRAEALALADAGAAVVVNDLGREVCGGGAASSVARTVAEDIRAAGGRAVANGDDVSTMAGGKAIVDAAIAAFGRLDILVNNAGVIRPAPIWEMTEQDWDQVLGIHLKGHFALVRHAAPIFRAQRGGVIVNTASESGLGHYGMSNYSAAKEGIIGFTRAIARELGQFGVYCYAIRPRALTRMAVPEVLETVLASQERLGFAAHGNRWVNFDENNPPEQVGTFVAWLCTDAATPANGRDFFVGGEEIALYSEPDIARVIRREGGWDLGALRQAIEDADLLDGLLNIFAGRGQEVGA